MAEKPVLQVYFVRHGESYGNVSYECPVEYGRDDPPLTPEGRMQAQALGEYYSALQFDAIFASPLTRAVETAHAVAQRQKNAVKVQLLRDLVETGTEGEGCPDEVLKKEYPLAVPCEDKSAFENETHESAHERGLRVVDFIIRNYKNGERVMLVSHGGFFGYVIRNFVGLGLQDDFRWKVSNTAVTKISFYPNEKPKLCFANNLAHLPGKDLLE